VGRNGAILRSLTNNYKELPSLTNKLGSSNFSITFVKTI
jgi:hypothetical protein